MSDIIVTHRHGMLAIYTRNGTAELTQRAIVDVGDDDLQSRELIDIADELAHRFGWQQRQLPPARGQVPKALAAAQAKQKRGYTKHTRHRAGYAEMARRRDAIVEYVAQHPDCTAGEIATALGSEVGSDTTPAVRLANVRKSMDILMRDGRIARGQSDGRLWLYRVVDNDAS